MNGVPSLFAQPAVRLGATTISMGEIAAAIVLLLLSCW